MAANDTPLSSNPNADLRVHGYATGDYCSRCVHCGQAIEGVAKRCVTCKPCAEKRKELRAGFEEWTRTKHPRSWPNPDETGERMSDGFYRNRTLDCMWDAWLAGRASVESKR